MGTGATAFHNNKKTPSAFEDLSGRLIGIASRRSRCGDPAGKGLTRTRKTISLVALAGALAVAGPALARSFGHHMTDTLTVAPAHYNGHCPGLITFHGQGARAGQFPTRAPPWRSAISSAVATAARARTSSSTPATTATTTSTDTWTLGGAPAVEHFEGWEHYKTWVTDSAEGGAKGGPGTEWSDKASFTLVCKK